MDRLARFREVVAKAKAHPVYREKLRDVDPEKLTLKDLSSLPTTREEWLAYLGENPKPPEGASLMHLTPSPVLGWMPEYLSQEDLHYQAEALAAHYRRLGLVGKKVLVAFSYHVFAGGGSSTRPFGGRGTWSFPTGPGRRSGWRSSGSATALTSSSPTPPSP